MIESYIDFKIIDNFFPEDKHQFALSKCRELPYFWGETEGASYPPTGMVADVEEESSLYDLFVTTIRDKVEQYRERIPANFYVNLFSPKELSYYHVDAQKNFTGTTLIYYPQLVYDKNDGGETLFFDEEKNIVFGVPPIPNRLVIFDSKILHKATSFHSRHRFTVVIKYCDQIS